MSYEQVEKSKRAYAAAIRAVDEKIGPSQAAKDAKVNRTSVTHGIVVYLYGSEEEKQAAKEGRVGIRTLGLSVKSRLTPEQKAEQEKRRRTPVISVDFKDEIKFQKTLWNQFKPALETLSIMPDVDSVVSLVKASNGRESTVNQHIQAARAWLEDFAYAWKQYQQSKGGNSDA